MTLHRTLIGALLTATALASPVQAATKAAAKPDTKPNQAAAAPPKPKQAAVKKPVPLPRPRPAVAAAAPRPGGHVLVAPAAAEPLRQAAVTPAVQPPPAPASVAVAQSDLDAVKRALDLVRRGKSAAVSDVVRAVGDPAARKLIEWAALRAETEDFNFDRYAAFIAHNAGWPNVVQFRRKAEAALWQNSTSEATIRSYFAKYPPLSAKGKLALARALLAQGERAQAQHWVRDVWRNESLSADMEKKTLDTFGPLLTAGDHKARMDRRFYAEDVDEGTRAAQRIGGPQVAIAKARTAVFNKTANAKALLEAVPADARNDTLYIFSMAQWLRRNDKIAEAAQWMLKAPTARQAIHDPEEWWTERRLLARKLLDIGDPQTAFKVAAPAATPDKEHPRVEHLFTAGWIALRFLNDPKTALPYFARIAQAAEHPASLARSHYWQGRTAEALGRRDEARQHYERGAQYATAYYGQLARAKLGAGEIRLPPAPVPAAHGAGRELVRAMEILYAIDERDLVVSAVADLADKATDIDTLAAVAALAEKNQDARAMALLGRIAIGRGLPFEAYAYPVAGLPRYKPVGPQVEPHIAYAIARQESGFNPRAVSSANALGLMQVTPAAGRYIAKKNGIAFDQKRLLNDPVYNVQMGAAELGDVIETYRGSYILAFVAYNAGRGRVREWTERYGDPRDPKVDPVDWVERIPFSETRNYVQRVMENMQIYRVRFGGSPKLMIEADLRRGMAAN